MRDSTVINRPIEAMFECVASEKFMRRMVASGPTAQFSQVSEGAMGVGTKFQVVFGAGDRAPVSSIEIIAYRRPTLFAFSSARGVYATIYTWRLQATPTGTRVTFSMKPRLETAVGRFLSPLVLLISPRGRVDEQKFRQYLEDRCEY